MAVVAAAAAAGVALLPLLLLLLLLPPPLLLLLLLVVVVAVVVMVMAVVVRVGAVVLVLVLVLVAAAAPLGLRPLPPRRLFPCPQDGVVPRRWTCGGCHLACAASALETLGWRMRVEGMGAEEEEEVVVVEWGQGEGEGKRGPALRTGYSASGLCSAVCRSVTHSAGGEGGSSSVRVLAFEAGRWMDE